MPFAAATDWQCILEVYATVLGSWLGPLQLLVDAACTPNPAPMSPLTGLSLLPAAVHACSCLNLVYLVLVLWGIVCWAWCSSSTWISVPWAVALQCFTGTHIMLLYLSQLPLLQQPALDLPFDVLGLYKLSQDPAVDADRAMFATEVAHMVFLHLLFAMLGFYTALLRQPQYKQLAAAVHAASKPPQQQDGHRAQQGAGVQQQVRQGRQGAAARPVSSGSSSHRASRLGRVAELSDTDELLAPLLSPGLMPAASYGVGQGMRCSPQPPQQELVGQAGAAGVGFSDRHQQQQQEQSVGRCGTSAVCPAGVGATVTPAAAVFAAGELHGQVGAGADTAGFTPSAPGFIQLAQQSSLQEPLQVSAVAPTGAPVSSELSPAVAAAALAAATGATAAAAAQAAATAQAGLSVEGEGAPVLLPGGCSPEPMQSSRYGRPPGVLQQGGMEGMQPQRFGARQGTGRSSSQAASAGAAAVGMSFEGAAAAGSAVGRWEQAAVLLQVLLPFMVSCGEYLLVQLLAAPAVAGFAIAGFALVQVRLPVLCLHLSLYCYVSHHEGELHPVNCLRQQLWQCYGAS
jgi:hypothetical protein